MNQVIGGVTGHVRTRWPEWALSVTLMVQTGLLSFAVNLHDNQLYVVIRQMLNVRGAALAAFFVGLAWFIALVLNGTFIRFRRISPWVRVLTAGLASLWWVLWGTTTWQAAHNYTSLGWTNYACLSAMSAMCVFMAAREVAHADIRAKKWHRMRRRIGQQSAQ